jgi:UDPglucose 6-dehydrogenase
MKSSYTMPKVGIIGKGIVGGAIANATAPEAILYIVDSDPEKGTHTYEDLFDCDGVFICTPTPQSADGKCDTSILLSVLDKLKGYKGVIISKSTAPIDVYTKLSAEYPNLVHSPEFLTEAKAEQDYIDGKFAFIGGNIPAYQREAERLIRLGQPSLSVVAYCTIGEAALAKYTINTFLATKVSFMNEIFALANKTNCNFDTVMDLVKVDNRIGRSHMQVPGPDGKMGFGGMCFPKDTAALSKFAEEQGVILSVLNAAIKSNKSLRDDL